MPWFWKKDPNCVHPWVESSIQSVALGVSRGKSSKTFPSGAFFLVLLTKSLSKCLSSTNFPCPKKFLVSHLDRYQGTGPGIGSWELLLNKFMNFQVIAIPSKASLKVHYSYSNNHPLLRRDISTLFLNSCFVLSVWETLVVRLAGSNKNDRHPCKKQK